MAARDHVDFTQNEYAPWNRAPFLMGKQSVLLIFYSFMQHMAFFMFGGDKGWWRSMLVMAALAGLQGLPGAENVLDFLTWVARKTLGQDIDLRVEAREMAQAIGLSPDFVMHGAMHSMFGLGWDTSGSIGLGRIIPGTDAVFGQGQANQRIMQMVGEVGGPFGALTVNILRAFMDENPRAILSLDRALPPFVRNIERAYRGAAENQWTDTRGRPLTTDVTGLEVLGQMAGFNPTRKSALQEQLFFQRDSAEYYSARRAHLLSSMFQARLARDFDAIADAKEAIARYNAQVPDRKLRITAQEISQSMKARERSAAETLTGVSARERYRSLYERVSGVFPETQ